MTTQYDTQYINSLSILELQELKALVALTLVKKYGTSEKNMKLLKESLEELAEPLGLGVQLFKLI